jgi:7-cyano-7-deazaguanine reductase
MTKINESELAHLSLGKSTAYKTDYDPSLLQPVPRQLARDIIGIAADQPLPFVGYDVWHAYELSWLNLHGKPAVALATVTVPYDSPNLIESKSFKLYLNSFNQTRFQDITAVYQALQQDLSHCAGRKVDVILHHVNELGSFQPTWLPGRCIDDLDVSISDYDYNPALLRCDPSQQVEEKLHSHLLKSNCLITSQPDWASVFIHYKGAKLDDASLLKYLISFRMHNEFHEQCVERIYQDLSTLLQPEFLAVYACYTRRGGLDINPLRSSAPYTPPNVRLTRQ